MIKTISKSLPPMVKWATVIGATAAIVLTIQVNADSHRQANPASQAVVDVDQRMPASGFADLVEQVSPAVVHVATSGLVAQRSLRGQQFGFPRNLEEFFRGFPNRNNPPQEDDNSPKTKRPLGIGSGFIISADGFVVTNHHVVAQADEIIISLSNGEEYTAQVKGSDVKTDLALLKLKGAKNLPYVTWGDDNKSRVGDWVLAIGNPFGLGGSASIGIISARGRDIGSGAYDDYIQVDAAINRGNSGGPLFNIRGEVIGINTAIYSPNGGSVGIGFSIPASLAKNVISQLEDSGQVERAWIGVQIQPMNDELAEGFGRDNDHGALVTSTQADAPAAASGVQPGDIILSFDGQEIEKMRDLPKIVAQSSVGKKYKMRIWRNNKVKTLTIKPERFPDDDVLAGGPRSQDDSSVEPQMDEVLGAQLESLNDRNRQQYNLDSSIKGVLITQVTSQGLAAENGLRRGDVISTLNGSFMRAPSDVLDTIRSAQSAGRSTIPILLQRGGGARFLPFKLDPN